MKYLRRTFVGAVGQAWRGLAAELAPADPVSGFSQWRAGQLLRRVRLLAVLLAGVVAGGVVLDWLLLPSGIAGWTAVLRVGTAGLLLAIARAAYRHEGLHTAHGLLGAAIGVPLVVHVIGVALALGVAPTATVQLIYLLPPLAVLAVISPFPVTLREGLALQAPIHLALWIGAGLAAPALVVPVSLAGLLVGAAALWSQHVQLRTLLHYTRALSVDPLTQLANRRQIDRQLQQTQRPLSVLLIDIDYFKSINDTHGHAVGDEVLQHVADVLRTVVRHTDAVHPYSAGGCPHEVGRWGGEEFIVIAADTSLPGACAMAERLRETVERTLVASEAITVSVTVSIGVAECAPDEEAQATICRADAALYQAKDSGRNRVEAAA
ncbi:Diguanylate cyclase, GGDEF domain [Thiohalospira halophila DSM 15071]|uniref:diguanylate cyclase n=1 Tax=Thiohalospira halophila DSM 15071 TaxID=1123397 RepID=A0A1I1N246_9GAMM|nr:Diguanylate cyclase, GGDEF domain [Thiohalospira halophila DSM 15071]